MDASSAKQKGESLLPVAYFNMGAEYEHLRYFGEALQAYESAFEACLEELGSGHALTSKISSSVKQMKRKTAESKSNISLSGGGKGASRHEKASVGGGSPGGKTGTRS